MASTPENSSEREPAEDGTEFGRFRDLARKLARVPKEEIDAERAREEAEREERRDYSLPVSPA